MISFQTEQKRKPITRSEQLPYYAYVTAFLRTGIVLDTFYTWGPLNQHLVFNGKKGNARGTIFNNFILNRAETLKVLSGEKTVVFSILPNVKLFNLLFN